jgi:hypothetical protein
LAAPFSHQKKTYDADDYYDSDDRDNYRELMLVHATSYVSFPGIPSGSETLSG